MDARTCKASGHLSVVGADSDHDIVSVIEIYTSVHDDYQFATLALCANRPWAHNVCAQITPSKRPLRQ